MPVDGDSLSAGAEDAAGFRERRCEAIKANARDVRAMAWRRVDVRPGCRGNSKRQGIAAGEFRKEQGRRILRVDRERWRESGGSCFML